MCIRDRAVVAAAVKTVGIDSSEVSYAWQGNVEESVIVTKPFNMTILVLRIRKLIELSRYHRVTQGMIDPA